MISAMIQRMEVKSEFYQEFRKTLKELNGSYVKVGFPAGAEVGEGNESGSGHPPYESISEVARVAVWNEFGVPSQNGIGSGWKIPPRPFFRNAIDKMKEQIKALCERVAIDTMIGKVKGIDTALELIGIFAQNRVQKSITEMLDPPNAPSTVAAKGSSHPLIDSGQLRNSVTFVKIFADKNSMGNDPEGSI